MDVCHKHLWHLLERSFHAINKRFQWPLDIMVAARLSTLQLPLLLTFLIKA